PAGWKITQHEFENPYSGEKISRDRVFIPSRLSDNKILTDNDPGYVANLQMQASPELVKAWLEGDWNVIAGSAFENLSRNKHMIRQFPLKPWWTKWTALDWGTAKPYAVGWFVVPEEDLILSAKGMWKEKFIPKGSIIMYRELYGWSGKTDEGCREESWQ